jgi:hypothetical protein
MAGEYPLVQEVDEAAIEAARAEFEDLDTRQYVTEVYDPSVGVVNMHYLPGSQAVKSLVSTSKEI